DGRLYALDDSGPLYVFDAMTGKQIAKQRLIGTIARASLLYADGKLYACTTSGWHVLEPTEKGVKIIDKIRFGQGQEVHGSPIVSHGRIYLPTTETLYCLCEVNAKTGVDPRPDPPSEAPAGDDEQPALVQMSPVESLISPGERVHFTVRLYDVFGRFLKEAKADDVAFDVDNGGKIDEQGRFTADKGSQHVGCSVTAKVGDLTGKARIRIVPPLPWKFDFADQKIPVTWVGARYRHIPLDFDLLQSLKEKEERAGQLYIYFTTTFLNSGQNKASFNDRTPRRTWNTFLRYLELDQSDSVKKLAGAKKELEPALKAVKAAGVIADYKWTGEDGDVGLDVSQGKLESEGKG
ncbi:MAG: pyrrolo-quinoline quinone, partial [Candidatus Saccharimonadales bacterium]